MWSAEEHLVTILTIVDSISTAKVVYLSDWLLTRPVHSRVKKYYIKGNIPPQNQQSNTKTNKTTRNKQSQKITIEKNKVKLNKNKPKKYSTKQTSTKQNKTKTHPQTKQPKTIKESTTMATYHFHHLYNLCSVCFVCCMRNAHTYHMSNRPMHMKSGSCQERRTSV